MSKRCICYSTNFIYFFYFYFYLKNCFGDNDKEYILFYLNYQYSLVWDVPPSVTVCGKSRLLKFLSGLVVSAVYVLCTVSKILIFMHGHYFYRLFNSERSRGADPDIFYLGHFTFFSLSLFPLCVSYICWGIEQLIWRAFKVLLWLCFQHQLFLVVLVGSG